MLIAASLLVMRTSEHMFLVVSIEEDWAVGDSDCSADFGFG
jgi:hypothetical protein